MINWRGGRKKESKRGDLSMRCFGDGDALRRTKCLRSEKKGGSKGRLAIERASMTNSSANAEMKGGLVLTCLIWAYSKNWPDTRPAVMSILGPSPAKRPAGPVSFASTASFLSALPEPPPPLLILDRRVSAGCLHMDEGRGKCARV